MKASTRRSCRPVWAAKSRACAACSSGVGESAGPYLGAQQPAEEVDPFGRAVAGAGRDPLVALQGLGEQGGRGVVRVAVLGELGGVDCMIDGQGGGVGGCGLGVVMREGRVIVREQVLEGVGDPGVEAGAPRLRDVGVDGVAHQCVHEADGAAGGLDQQPGRETGLQPVEHLRLVGFGRHGDEIDIRLEPDGGGDAQDGCGSCRQPCDPAPEHVAHALGNLGHRDQGPLAGQQPHALPHVERVAAGALGDRVGGRGVDRRVVERANQPVHIGWGQPGHGDSVRRTAGQDGERLPQPVADVCGPEGGHQQDR